MDLGRYNYLLQSKENFLYSVATENSTMDKLTTMIENGVVDSPPSCGALPMTVRSLSPLRVKLRSTM
jgi:hypothetical protein